MYIEGFKGLTWGKPLWNIIIAKIIVLSAIAAFLASKNPMKNLHTNNQKSEYIFNEFVKINNN
jgi:hypothetical protein